MKLYYDIFDTSLGRFAVAVDEKGALIAAGFGGKEGVQARRGDELIADAKATASAREQIQSYLEGKLRMFKLRLAPRGTPFQQSVWSALLKIPFGRTRSYGEIAAEVGRAGASRAVGQAVGSNPLCLVIPCHRVIASDGSLGGFAFGLETKRRLLKLEGAQVRGLE
jgi:methylated-DNA-[protein]-cysteine S-methyltransferase